MRYLPYILGVVTAFALLNWAFVTFMVPEPEVGQEFDPTQPAPNSLPDVGPQSFSEVPPNEGTDRDEPTREPGSGARNFRIVNGYHEISWIDLADVSFVDKYYPEVEQIMLFPKFGETVQGLEGKKVSIPGYIIPIDEEKGQYVLSAFPMSACFFCGGAGPESVVQLNLTESDASYKVDDWATFKGTLRLNDEDIDQMNYILESASEAI
ncbi:MAG: hypothetical protein AAGI38_02900 [Bacteroidota bacterium]